MSRCVMSPVGFDVGCLDGIAVVGGSVTGLSVGLLVGLPVTGFEVGAGVGSLLGCGQMKRDH